MNIEWFASSWLPLIAVIAGTLGMYLVVVVLARFSGVRSFAQMSTFDIAVTIAIGSLMAATVASENPPLAQGVTAVLTLYAVQLTVSRMRARYRGVQAATDNAPILLMGPGGELRHLNMRIARVTEDDLRAHLRRANVTDPRTVRAVVMEGTGVISVMHGGDGALADDAWILQGVRNHDV